MLAYVTGLGAEYKPATMVDISECEGIHLERLTLRLISQSSRSERAVKASHLRGWFKMRITVCITVYRKSPGEHNRGKTSEQLTDTIRAL